MEDKNHSEWMVLNEDKKEAIIGYFNGLQRITSSVTKLIGKDFIDDALYEVKVRKQNHNIKEFGGLINMVLPVRLNENGVIINAVSKHKDMPGENEEYVVDGKMLNSGSVKLKQEWTGTGFDDSVRLLGDFGSRLYYINIKEK